MNIVGRVKNNNFEKDSETVCGMGFTVEEIDYLDNRAEAEARRAGDGRAQPNAARHAAHANA